MTLSQDTRAIVRATDALTAQVRRIADAVTAVKPVTTAVDVPRTESLVAPGRKDPCTATLVDSLGSAALIRCILTAGHYDETDEPAWSNNEHSPGGWHSDGEGRLWSDRAAQATAHGPAETPASPDTTHPGPSLMLRVVELYERWLKAGPPPLGTSTARWWDARLLELCAAINGPRNNPS